MPVKYPHTDAWEAVLVDGGEGIVTGGGVSLCIDTTLYLLGDLGERVADETAGSWSTSGHGGPSGPYARWGRPHWPSTQSAIAIIIKLKWLFNRLLFSTE